MRRILAIGWIGLLLGWSGLLRAEIPHPPILLLTAQEDGTEPQDTFSCDGTIHAYVTFPRAQSGHHTLEGIWTGPKGTVIQHSRNDIDYPSGGGRTAAVWLQFTKEGHLWNPLSVQSAGDEDRLAYDGPWKIEIRWDNRPLAQSAFHIHCL